MKLSKPQPRVSISNSQHICWHYLLLLGIRHDALKQTKISSLAFGWWKYILSSLLIVGGNPSEAIAALPANSLPDSNPPTNLSSCQNLAFGDFVPDKSPYQVNSQDRYPIDTVWTATAADGTTATLTSVRVNNDSGNFITTGNNANVYFSGYDDPNSNFISPKLHIDKGATTNPVTEGSWDLKVEYSRPIGNARLLFGDVDSSNTYFKDIAKAEGFLGSNSVPPSNAYQGSVLTQSLQGNQYTFQDQDPIGPNPKDDQRSNRAIVDYKNTYIDSFQITYAAGADSSYINNTSGSQALFLNSGMSAGCDIEGTVFEDSNGNDLLNSSEPLLNNVAVSVYLDDGDGVFKTDGSDLLIETQDTATGAYKFTNLAEDEDYWILVDESDSDLNGYQYDGGNADLSQVNPRLVSVTASNVTDVNFPFAALRQISGTVFEDTNRNNIREASESPLANVDIALFPDSNNDGILNDDPNGDGQITFADAVGRMDSDADGNYSFDAPDGNYLVYIRTNDPDLVGRVYGGVINQPNDPLNSRRNADIVGANILSGLDFPFDPLSISGTIYDDVNRNDVKDSFENPLANIFVALFRDLNNDGILNGADDPDGDGLGFDDAVDQMSSNANGNYGFIVPDGNYLVYVNTNDADLAGRTYGGVVNVPNDPLNSIRNADISGANILSGLDYPFDQEPPDVCDAGDSTDQVNFLNNPTLIKGSLLQIGAVYRFDTVFDNVDALVEVVQFNGGATLGAMDNNSTGEPAAFQPTLSAASNTTSSVDFEITLVDATTGLPAVMNFKAAGVDIDGNGGGLREFIELSNLTSFTLDPNTTIEPTPNPPITRFESDTFVSQPGISSRAITTLVVAQYNEVSQFRYSIGAIDGGTSGSSLNRLNSLYIGCAERVESDLDYGDAPDTYGTDNTVGNSSNTNDPLGAIHLIDPDLFLGATVPDADSNGFVDGTDDNGNATDDDDPSGTGTGNGDDEDNFALPNLRSGDTSYTIPASALTATNNTGQAATLHAWIDFDNSGTFEDTEHASVTVDNATNNANPTGDLTWNNINAGVAGDTYARFRLTTDSDITNATPGGAAIDGEVEDYQIAIAPAFLCPAAKADLWFANDESGSVSSTEFNNALDFIYQISDGFVYDNATGMKAGITGWTDQVNSIDIVMPITESFGDSGDFGLFQNGNISLNSNSQGIRELYTSKQNSSPGTRLDYATNHLTDLIVAGNGKRTDVPQVAIMLTDADSSFISNLGQGGSFAWVNEANLLRSTGTEIVLILIDEAATAYNTDGVSKFIIDSVVGSNGKVITVPNYAAAADSTLGYVDAVSQAVCDLSTPMASDPGLLLVKRITAIYPAQPGEPDIQFNQFVDQPNFDADNHPLWPDSDEDPSSNTNLYLRGALNGGKIKPGDEIEYTIYFLSSGDDPAQQVQICDVVPEHLTYIEDAYSPTVGMTLGYDTTVIQSSPNQNLTNPADSDIGEFYPAGTAPPVGLCKKLDSAGNLVVVDDKNNNSGVIVVRPAASLPSATSPGQPAGSYGFIRFRGKVK